MDLLRRYWGIAMAIKICIEEQSTASKKVTHQTLEKSVTNSSGE